MTTRLCLYCDEPAVWRWTPLEPPIAHSQLLCDDHAAAKDPDDLDEL